jgi:hypothetical protein
LIGRATGHRRTAANSWRSTSQGRSGVRSARTALPLAFRLFCGTLDRTGSPMTRSTSASASERTTDVPTAAPTRWTTMGTESSTWVSNAIRRLGRQLRASPTQAVSSPRQNAGAPTPRDSRVGRPNPRLSYRLSSSRPPDLEQLSAGWASARPDEGRLGR